MANINTTATMKKTSAMLSGKCKKTQENLKKLMADAGCADGEGEPAAGTGQPGRRGLCRAERRELLLYARDGLRNAGGGGGNSEELRGDVIS